MKIRHEKSKCIGCGSCAAVCPDFFEMEEGEVFLATLKKHTINSAGEEELIIESVDPSVQEAIDVCPVQIIHLENGD
ncbi:MAG: ferredoxin [Candidatus Portnoybacteria bacterium CG10_big_fil_rev_8_21_14_0_10_36_7]|uniref:Ferredoxin n=1 Tax=Candidatus Portnoybacteria bacterium CG10_big_fil_rev_8_21_14_0_10_36_7 TaxID=1974812 RepID=A0A2M8KES3_9BACT|nr:MAG: ferredoxin [Candidatus Portnoybacteria bacterium CG10_big_fil_rev_8_21_14_0_10_36_7]